MCWRSEPTPNGVSTAYVRPTLAELDLWLATYRRLWTAHLDRLETHLESRRTDGRRSDRKGPTSDAADEAWPGLATPVSSQIVLSTEKSLKAIDEACAGRCGSRHHDKRHVGRGRSPGAPALVPDDNHGQMPGTIGGAGDEPGYPAGQPIVRLGQQCRPACRPAK